jgi:hypothetical protein
MAKRAARRETEWDELTTSTDFRELFRYEKAGRVRIYNLRAVTNGAELWMVSAKTGKLADSKKKTTFDNPAHAVIFLEEIERTLTAGGWRRLSP